MQTYQVSCHCGTVCFTVDIDLSRGTLRCNCSFCARLRWWTAIVAPGAFRLVSGAEALGDYQFHARREHHFFCRQCGIHVFGTGESPRWGPFCAVNLACLIDALPEDLAAAPVQWVDGKNDAWDQAPGVTAHL